jgi:hypothetical protein
VVVGLVEGGAWPPMLWIGGAQGAGKSTLATPDDYVTRAAVRPLVTHEEDE